MADPAHDTGAGMDHRQIARFLWVYLRPYRAALIGAVVALVFTVCVTLVMPIAARMIVDGYDSAAPGGLVRYFLMALGLIVLFSVGSSLRIYLFKLVGERAVADLRKSVFARMIRMSPAFYDHLKTGEVLSRLTADTALVLNATGWSTAIALRNAMMLVGSGVLMLMTSGKLTLMVVVLIPVMLGPIALLGRRLRGHSRVSQDRIAQSSGAASEWLRAAPEVQSHNYESQSISIFGGLTQQALGAATRVIGTQALMQATVMVLAFAGVLGVLWMGATDVMAGAMTRGQLVQFVVCALLATEASSGLTTAWAEVQRAAGAAERLFELLKVEDLVQDPEDPEPFVANRPGAVVFDTVCFAYPARPEVPVLDGVSVTIQPGETVALVGPSGAGKSTVLQLLQRFYDPDSGVIYLGGTDLRDMTRTAFRAAIAVVQQDPAIFASSARDNIRFGRADATDAEVEAAARAAAAHDFLARLPDGYDTFLGEQGVMLSGGQKQRIAIARAILRDAPILLLDEATSALDAESEQAVQSALAQLAADRTTFVIAHRLATVTQADRILVFDAGRIVAEGTHASLIAENGLYARLAALQFASA